MNPHIWPAVITLLAVLLMLWTGMLVARARKRYGIVAPATTGNPDFERVFRVQMNTLEQGVVFLPLLWLAAAYGHPLVVAVAGMVWVVGRVMYALAYAKDASKRGPGFGIAAVGLLTLLATAIIGVARAAFWL